jgi:predicted nucleic acid-binding protein
MTSVIVADAGPLMVLAKLNLLHLLKELYDQVEFSQSVYDEIVTDGLRRGYQDAHVLEQFFRHENWVPVPIESGFDSFQHNLDVGERDSIELAKLHKATLLMDEEHGREIARQQGIRVRGSLGVLVEAYHNGLISSNQLQLFVGQMIERSDIWISPDLCRRVLQEVLKTKG